MQQRLQLQQQRPQQYYPIFNNHELNGQQNRVLLQHQPVINNNLGGKQPNNEQNKQLTLKINQTSFLPSEDNEGEIQIIKSILTAQKSLDICMYCISNFKISCAILMVLKNGVDVRIISDQEQIKKDYSLLKNMKILCENQYQKLRIKTNRVRTNFYQLQAQMHHKFTVVDTNLLCYGSVNYSNLGCHDNFEDLKTTDHIIDILDYQNRFDNLWNDKDEFQDYNVPLSNKEEIESIIKFYQNDIASLSYIKILKVKLSPQTEKERIQSYYENFIEDLKKTIDEKDKKHQIQIEQHQIQIEQHNKALNDMKEQSRQQLENSEKEFDRYRQIINEMKEQSDRYREIIIYMKKQSDRDRYRKHDMKKQSNRDRQRINDMKKQSDRYRQIINKDMIKSGNNLQMQEVKAENKESATEVKIEEESFWGSVQVLIEQEN